MQSQVEEFADVYDRSLAALEEFFDTIRPRDAESD
jgi:hypothetical protein